MAFTVRDAVGFQPIANTETTQMHPLGSTIEGIDPTYGEGEFIYLKGVASTVVGNAVVWDTAFQTTRTVAASRGAVAIAMSANVANQYGWYQIRGLAQVKTATVAAEVRLQLTATAGQLDDTTTAAQDVAGCITKSTDSGGLATCSISYPSANGTMV